MRFMVEFGEPYAFHVRGVSQAKAEKIVRQGGGIQREVEFRVNSSVNGHLIGIAQTLGKLGERCGEPTSAIVSSGKITFDGPYWWSGWPMHAFPPRAKPKAQEQASAVSSSSPAPC